MLSGRRNVTSLARVPRGEHAGSACTQRKCEGERLGPVTNTSVPEALLMEPSLSSYIRTALSRRAPTDVLFQLARVKHSLLALETVTVRQWVCFAEKVLARVAESPVSSSSSQASPHMPPSHTCDVEIACRETFHACLLEAACLCGAKTFCVLNPDDPSNRLDELRGQIRPSVQFTDADVHSLLDDVSAASDSEEDWHELSLWSATVERLVIPCADSCAAYFIYTSGSTGSPKCVMGSRGNLSAYGYLFARDKSGLACSGTHCGFLTLSTPFFDPSLGDLVCVLLSEHGWQRMVARECLVNGDLPLLLQAQPPPTHIISTPALWGTIPASAAADATLSATTKLFLGGEKLTQRLIDTWSGAVQLHNIYGVTEATVYQSVKRVLPGTNAQQVTCGSGTALNGLDIRPARVRHSDDVDDESRDEGATNLVLEAGAVGEVVLSGPQVCLGYASDLIAVGHARPPFCDSSDANAREYWTGDLAHWVPFGDSGECGRELVLIGRSDRQVKVNGQRTSLEEVETTMTRALEGAAVECCCGAYTDDVDKVVITAGCVVAVQAGCTGKDIVYFGDHAPAVQRGLQAILRHHLPLHAVPSAWLLLPSTSPEKLPRTATGKLDRKRAASLARLACGATVACAQRQAEETDEWSAVTAVPHSLLAAVRKVWEAELGIPVHLRTNFFLVGGDSLGALKLCRAVFMALDGRDALIDDCGGLPLAYRPHVLMQHPRFLDYTVALSKELHTTEDVAHKDKPGHTTPEPHRLPTPVSCQAESTSDSYAHHGGNNDAEALLAAVSIGNVRFAELLIKYGVSAVNGFYSRTTRCVTPLHVAATLGDEAMTELLLNCGAKVTAVSPDGVTPLHIAAGRSQAVLERLLQEPGVPVRSRDDRQQSLLHVAARHGCAETVSYLITVQGLDVAVRDKWQRSPAHWAVLHMDTRVLRAMTEACRAQRSAPTSDVSRKRGRPTGTNRFVRLAQKRTTLPYETILELAARVAPENQELLALCKELTPIIEQ